MAIGTPTSIGSATSILSASSLTITTSAAIVAGNLVVVAIAVKGANNPTISTVSDGTNTYTLAKLQVSTNANIERCAIYYKENASAVASGASLTVTLSAVLGATPRGVSAAAVQLTGIATASSLDAAAASGNFTNNALTVSTTTGTLAQGSEIVFGALAMGTGSAYTESSGFTNLFSDLNGANSGALSLGYNIRAATTAVVYNPSVGSTTGLAAVAVPFKAPLLPPPQNPWETGFVNYAEPPPWRAAPVDSNTLWMLTANVRPNNKKIWRYDYVPDPVWLADPTPTNIRTFPAAAALPSPVVVPHAREDTNWTWGPQPSDTLYLLTAGGEPFSRLWRYDHVPDPPWVWEAPPDWTLLLPSAGRPAKQWRYDHVPDPPWYASPQPSDTIFQLTANGAPTKPRQWRWDHVPDPVWLADPVPTNIETFPSAAAPPGKLWRWDILSDPIWYAAPVSTNIGTIPALGTPVYETIVILHGSHETAWWQGAPLPVNIETFPVAPAATPQTQFWAPRPPDKTEWQWRPPYNVELLPVAGQPFSKQWRWDHVPDASWIWTAPPSDPLRLLTAGGEPFSRLWHYDLTPPADWTWSPQPSDTLYLLTAGGKPFFHQWRYDYQADAVWQGAPQPTNLETLPAPGTPVYETVVILHGSHETAWWQGAPTATNIGTLPSTTPTLLGVSVIDIDGLSETAWIGTPRSTNIGTFPAGTPPFSKLWRYDYQADAVWQGAPVSVNIETFPAAGLPFGRLWRYDLTPSPDWTWQPPASGVLRALTAGGAPTHLQWRYDYTPEPVWRSAPVSASYAALKESGKPFTIQWRYDWDSGRSWWQGAPIGVNVPIANPGPPVPVIPPTTGAGGELPPGYRWRWTDFNDRAWLKAFRDEFYRLRRLKNPERRRRQFEVLEQKFIGAAERALEYETPYEKKLDLVQLGELLQGFAAPASFDRIEMYLVALAAEIDDEEAFLLLND